MAAIIQKGNKFYITQWSSIHKKTIWSEPYSTEKAAERDTAAFVKKVKNGYAPESKRKKIQPEDDNPYKNITFGKIYEDFCDTTLTETYKSRNNRDTFKIMLENHVIPVIGKYPIADITYGQIQTMFSKMKLLKGTEPLSASSKRKIVGYMNKIYEYAIRCEYVTDNPCRKLVITAPSVIFDKQVFDEEQLCAFMDWCKHNLYYGYYLGFLIACTTASRRSEICGLRYSDLDNEFLNKNRGVDRYGDITDMKNHVSHRGIYLMDITRDAIEEQKRRQNVIIHTIGDRSGIQHHVKPWDYILTDEWNYPIKPDVLTKNFRKAVLRYQREVDSSLPYISLKGLRDTYASIALASGENIREVSEQLGHARPSTTLNRYAALVKTPTKGLNMRMNDRIFKKKDSTNSSEII